MDFPAALIAAAQGSFAAETVTILTASIAPSFLVAVSGPVLNVQRYAHIAQDVGELVVSASVHVSVRVVLPHPCLLDS